MKFDVSAHAWAETASSPCGPRAFLSQSRRMMPVGRCSRNGIALREPATLATRGRISRVLRFLSRRHQLNCPLPDGWSVYEMVRRWRASVHLKSDSCRLHLACRSRHGLPPHSIDGDSKALQLRVDTHGMPVDPHTLCSAVCERSGGARSPPRCP